MRNLILLSIALAACAKTVAAPGGLGEPCVANGDCATGFLCAAGRCVLPANLGGCEPGRLRCNGADVEKCGDNGLGWDLVSSCATGCSAGACKPQVCTPGRTRCDGNASEQCTPAGDAWALVQICPSTCAADTGLCRAPVCTPFATRCDPAGDPALAQICDSAGATWQNLACATGQVCDGGRCLDRICAAGETRCSANGGSVEICNDKRDAFAESQSCAIRCAVSGGVAACLSPVCDAGSLRCSPTVASALEQCLPDRSAWGFVTFCGSGCASSAPGSAACAPPVCAPFSRRCTSTGSGVETCKADGTGWAQTDTCPQGCVAGNCTTTTAGCSPGDLRCNGVNAQACATVSPGVTQWNTTAACLAGCSSGACLPGGSCAGVSLHAAASSAPGDGISTVLVYSDVIAGADGAPVPDGQPFTVAISPQGTVVGGGLVKSFAGRIHFKVLAPALSTADVAATVTAQLASSAFCQATTPITFTAAASSTILVAEDFTSAALRNLSVANAANWDAADGAIIARWPGDSGDGRDGALIVAAGAIENLSTDGHAPAFAVLGLSGRNVNLDSTASGLSGGDEVILWDAQGSSSGTSNAGNYELHHVASTNGSQITLAEDLGAYFGAGADQDVALQHVSLQRVPHFSSLTIANTGAVTANPWDGSKGGLVFIRVAGVAKIQGEIKMDAAGFRGGKLSGGSYYGEDFTGFPSLGGSGAGYYQGGAGYGSAGSGTSAGVAYGLPLLGKLYFGAGGGAGSTQGGNGGGAIVLFAQSVTLAADTSGAQQGRIHADGQLSPNSGSGSGAGGSIWISAPTVMLGTGGAGAISAQGGGANGAGGAGGAGRVRVDQVSTDVGASCARSAPACSFGINGPLVAQSLDEYVAPGVLLIRTATLNFALGTAPGMVFKAAASTPDPPDFGIVPQTLPGLVTFASAGSPAVGTRFRWQAAFTPQPGAPQILLGLQWSVTVN